MIDQDRELFEKALGALEQSVSTCFDQYSHHEVMSRPEHFMNRAMKALRDRLAQPEQEPVQDDLIPPDSLFVCNQMGANVTRVRLAEPVQEPVACKTLCELCVKRGYTFCANAVKTTPINTPPRREWVGLTDEEIYKIDCLLITNITELVIAIERKLKEKNNG